MAEINPPPAIVEAFRNVGHTQRAEPEARMRDAQHYCSGLWTHLLEHVGDLTHRLTERWPISIYVGKKAVNALYDLRRKPPDNMAWDEDVRGQFRGNARYHNIPLPEYLAELERLGAAYSEAHKQIPVYNRTLWLAREAAIALGYMDWDRAEKALAEWVEPIVETPLLEEVREYRLGSDGLPLEYPWKEPWQGETEKGPGVDILKPGRYWFEYHCFESSESCDAELWYHSHQPVEVLGVSPGTETFGLALSFEERGADGVPLVYSVRFDDGLEYDAVEDEILESPDEFYRPDPPPPPPPRPENFSGEVGTPPKMKYPRIWIAAVGGPLKAARHLDPPEEVLRLLAAQDNPEVRIAVAGNFSTPADILRILATDPDYRSRCAVAANVHTLDETLYLLLRDKELCVRSIAEEAVEARKG